jgi:dinuclear metal center YbgI/SA1388 family protein
MQTARTETLVAHCEHLLRPGDFADYDRAHNGLQVSNLGEVSRIAAAVDASFATVCKAAAAGADLLVVHHGLFWGETVPWTGRRHELLRVLIESDMAIYSSHLPLDAHPELGNAAQLARALGLRALKPFFLHKGRHLGWRAVRVRPRDDLARSLGALLGRPPVLLPGGPTECRHIGICTGGAGAELRLAAAAGVDTFITGEGPHWTHALAEDAGINVFYGGHYATETFGVRALAETLSKHFRIPWSFIDHPSGL